jgi:hypothetical protein
MSTEPMPSAKVQAGIQARQRYPQALDSDSFCDSCLLRRCVGSMKRDYAPAALIVQVHLCEKPIIVHLPAVNDAAATESSGHESRVAVLPYSYFRRFVFLKRHTARARKCQCFRLRHHGHAWNDYQQVIMPQAVESVGVPLQMCGVPNRFKALQFRPLTHSGNGNAGYKESEHKPYRSHRELQIGICDRNQNWPADRAQIVR